MIVIKIKTWKDWKKDFLDWVKEPRKSISKSYVNYMETILRTTIDDRFKNIQKDLGVSKTILQTIIDTAQIAVSDAKEATHKLIDGDFD